MDEARRKGADEAAAALVIGMRHPFIERLGVGEVLFNDFVQHLFVEVVGSVQHLVFDHAARGETDLGHPVDTGLDVFVVRVAHPLAGLDQEVDDFGERGVEQGRQLCARADQGVEIELRGGKADSEIARTLDLICAFDDLAANEEGRRIGFGRVC